MDLKSVKPVNLQQISEKRSRHGGNVLKGRFQDCGCYILGVVFGVDVSLSTGSCRFQQEGWNRVSLHPKHL